MHTVTLAVGKLREGMTIARPVVASSGAWKNMVICRAGTYVTRRVLGTLVRHGVQKADVFSMSPRAPAPACGEPAPESAAEEKAAALYAALPPVRSVLPEGVKEKAVSNIKSVFAVVEDAGGHNMTTAYQVVRDFEKTLSQVVAAATNCESGYVHIHDLKSYDEYTFHHSLSVSLLSVATGQELGLDLKDSMELGRCGLLHDIGKQFVAWDIINKPGKLTDDEFRLVMEHPSLGVQNLKAKGFASVTLTNGILFHHEKENGRGYPKGLAGTDIPLFAKIIAVADVFDALTSYRSYRKPLTPTAAFEIISADAGAAFDRDVLAAFLKRLELYPVNTIIELSSGKIATVIENSNSLRPVVACIHTKEALDLASPRYRELAIAGVLGKEEFAQKIK